MTQLTDLMPRRKRDDDSSVLPLINIVFLLLIFFMVAGQIDLVGGNDITPPVSRSEESIGNPPMVLLLDRHNVLRYQGETLNLEQLVQRVRELQQDNADIAIALKADAQLKAVELDAVFDVLRAEGISRITLYSTNQQVQP